MGRNAPLGISALGLSVPPSHTSLGLLQRLRCACSVEAPASSAGLLFFSSVHLKPSESQVMFKVKSVWRHVSVSTRVMSLALCWSLSCSKAPHTLKLITAITFSLPRGHSGGDRQDASVLNCLLSLCESLLGFGSSKQLSFSSGVRLWGNLTAKASRLVTL